MMKNVAIENGISNDLVIDALKLVGKGVREDKIYRAALNALPKLAADATIERLKCYHALRITHNISKMREKLITSRTLKLPLCIKCGTGYEKSYDMKCHNKNYCNDCGNNME